MRLDLVAFVEDADAWMDKYFETVIAEFLQLCLLASPVIQINGVHITLNAQ